MFNRSLMLKLSLLVIVLAEALPINSPAYGQIIPTNPQQRESFQERMSQQQLEQTQQMQQKLQEIRLRLNLQQPQLQQQRGQHQEFTQQRQELRRLQQLRLQHQPATVRRGKPGTPVHSSVPMKLRINPSVITADIWFRK
ncbi:hypothetical protein LC605_32425 [Nostoc sp. CHAB 5836]|uniref:hypothetical protein n=1 Tax=Nostoc sp. CHAB 5836 TaxID=2780404 RepID=UPI001E559DA1|nr:hypothetical protein [Nostoc sp. CHAB 5836]MCC5619656.1 hypothetical protein [Nostoc sp. CHAB 5836]